MAILAEDDAPPSSGSISHAAHLKHKLTLEATGHQIKFKCDGCHEQGTGERYTCLTCNFDLHKQCAVHEGTMLMHPLLKSIQLVLRFQAPGPKDARLVCDACSKVVLGFHYHNSKLCLHPCCANPPVENEKEKEKEEDGPGRGQSSGTGMNFVLPILDIFDRMVQLGVPITQIVTGDMSGIPDLFSNIADIFSSGTARREVHRK